MPAVATELRIRAVLDGAQARTAAEALQKRLNQTFVQQRAAAQLSTAVATLTTAMANTAAGAARLTRTQRLLARASDVTTAALGRMRAMLAGLNKFLVVAIPLALAAFAKKTVDASRTAEVALAKVSTLADFTTGELDKMREGTNKLAKEFGISFEAISEARFDVVSSGFASVAEQQKILAGGFTLGAANATDMTVATKTLTSVLAAFGRDASQTNRTMDELTVIAQNSKTNLEGLSRAITLVAPTANTAGFSLAQVGGALDVMTLAGISADESATALNSALRTLSNPATRDAIEAAGIAIRDLETGAVRPLEDILLDLSKQAPDTLKNLVPDIRAQRAFDVLTKNAELFRSKVATIESEDSVGKTAEAAAKAAATLDFQLKRLGETINERIRQLNIFGTSLTNLVREIADFLGGDDEIVAAQKRIAELVDREQSLLRARERVKNRKDLRERFDEELAENRKHQARLQNEIRRAGTLGGVQGPQLPGAPGAPGVVAEGAPTMEVLTKAQIDAAKKAAEERRMIEQDLAIEVASLRGEEGLAFDLELQRRIEELREAGVEELKIRELIHASQMEFVAMAVGPFDEGGALGPEKLTSFQARLAQVEESVRQFGTTMFDVFGGALSGQITEVFQAFGAGEKVNMKKFVGSILQALGQAAIAEGTFAILAGTARLLFGDPAGGALIAAGGALVAFGGAISAAGAALVKKGAGGGAAAGAMAGTPGGIRAAGGEVQQRGPALNLTVQALDPSQVDWDDIFENQIGPAAERTVGRGASNLQLQAA